MMMPHRSTDPLSTSHPPWRAGLVPVLTNTLVVLGIWAGTRFLQRSRPIEYTFLVLEDGWIEYGSFVAWMLAVVLFSWAFAQARNSQRVVYVLLALCAFFMAMEEISWGQRVFGWEGPKLLRESNLQSESNLHNLVPVFHIYRPLASCIVAWTVLAWSLTHLAPRLRGLCDRLAIPVIPPRLWPWFFLSAAFLAERFHPKPQEVGELLLAVAVAVLALDTVSTMKDGFLSRIPNAAVPLIVVPTLLAGTILTVHALPEPPKGALGGNLNELGYHRLVSGWYSHAVLIYDYLSTHPEHHFREDGQLFHALALRSVGREAEAKRALEGYPGLHRGAGHIDGPENPEWLLFPAQAQKLGLALCVSGRQSEARRLFEGIARTELGNLAEANRAVEQSESLYQTSVAFLALGYEPQAHRQIKKAVHKAGRRHARALRARYRDAEKLIGLAGCL